MPPTALRYFRLLLLAVTGMPTLMIASTAGVATTSPDGKLILNAAADASGNLRYTFEADGKVLVSPSSMGLDFGSAGKMPSAGWKITKTTARTVDEVWKPLWGKRASVPDRYSETTCILEGPDAPFNQLRVLVRAYDDGVAFRYEIPADAKGEAADAKMDRTEFNFSGDFTAWFYNGENHNLGPDPLSRVIGERQPVMVVKAAENSYLAVHEADLRSGEPMRLTKNSPAGFSLLAAPGKIAPGYIGPWRVIFFGRTPGAMVDSHLLELLNPPPAGDFSWVKPGHPSNNASGVLNPSSKCPHLPLFCTICPCRCLRFNPSLCGVWIDSI